MHFAKDLERLALHKAALQRSIARGREQCANASSQVARPLELLDRTVAIWRGIPASVKLGAVPLGLLATRLVLPRRGILGALVRWGPLVFTAVRAFGSGVGRDPATAGARRP